MPWSAWSVSSQQLRDWQRELRVTRHLYELGSIFLGQAACSRDSQMGRVCLVASARRVEFFSDLGLTPEEASLATARLYGDIVAELVVPEEHTFTIARCLTGTYKEFNMLFHRLLEEHRDDDCPLPVR